MKKCHIILMLCFYMIIMGCASKGASNDTGRAILENPLQVPLTANNQSVYIISKNTTQAKEDIDGLLLALLQSEYNMKLAESADSADYVINLQVEKFANTGTVDAPIDGSDVAIPVMIGAASGVQIGSAIDGGTGAAWGAGIGVMAGLGTAFIANDEQEFMWQMVVDITIEDKDKESFNSRINAWAQGVDMDYLEAAQALENEVAWAIVKAFQKNN